MTFRVKSTWMLVILAAFTGLLAPSAGAQAGARIDWIERVTSDGRHNAFTDLAKWKGHYYLCFRHGEAHNSMDGVIHVLRSADMRKWERVAVLRTMGDDRDPHFTATKDRLYVYFGIWDTTHSSTDAPPDRHHVRSHAAYTEDGETWSKVRAVYESGWWVWRVIEHQGQFYGVAYTAVRPRPDERTADLVRSDDGLHFTKVSTISTERSPSESDLWFDADGSLHVITRMEDTVRDAFYYRSEPPYTEWTAESLETFIQAPAVLHVGERLIVSGRARKDAGGSVTRIWDLTSGRPQALLTLPSGGDTSYTGMLADESADNAFFISWYSQHETERNPETFEVPAAVYVARVVLED